MSKPLSRNNILKQAPPTKKSTSISFNEQGIPYSNAFDDIYFDDSQGYQQSEDVFIKGNHLFSQWLSREKAPQDNKKDSDNTCFVIAETGFGTGLNFFLTLLHFEQFLKAFPQTEFTLKFLTVEKYPLSAEQIITALASFNKLTPLVLALAKHYPDEPKGRVQLPFLGGKVILDIIFDDACDGLKQVEKDSVDAWFLDGFAPKKNPQMWNDNLYQQMARLSKPQASLATFTVSGMVRRGLKSAGFWVEKQKGCASKEEILTGYFQGDGYALPKQGFKIRAQQEKPQHVTILGGGLASACVAYHLVKQGIKVSVFCQDDSLAKQASSNAIGAVYPLLHQQRDTISDFYATAFTYAIDLYQELAESGLNFSHDFSGLLEVAYKEPLQKRQIKFEQLTTWPKSLVHGVTAEQASEHAGVKLNNGGLFMPKAGWVCPPELVKALFEFAQQTGLCDIHLNIDVNEITQLKNDRWQLVGNQKKSSEQLDSKANSNTDKDKSSTNEVASKKFKHKCKTLILCTGAQGIKLDILTPIPLSAVRGQVSQVASSNKTSQLKTVICHKGYLTPQNNGSHCIGATFDKDDFCTKSRAEDDQYNLTMLKNCLPEFMQMSQWQTSDIIKSNANLRCCSPDHLPLVGAFPHIEKHQEIYWKLSKDKNLKYHEIAPTVKGLYMLTGLGARGLCSAPLLAKILTAELCHLAQPVDYEMQFNLAPNRFVIRDIVRSK